MLPFSENYGGGVRLTQCMPEIQTEETGITLTGHREDFICAKSEQIDTLQENACLADKVHFSSAISRGGEELTVRIVSLPDITLDTREKRYCQRIILHLMTDVSFPATSFDAQLTLWKTPAGAVSKNSCVSFLNKKKCDRNFDS